MLFSGYSLWQALGDFQKTREVREQVTQATRDATAESERVQQLKAVQGQGKAASVRDVGAPFVRLVTTEASTQGVTLTEAARASLEQVRSASVFKPAGSLGLGVATVELEGSYASYPQLLAFLGTLKQTSAVAHTFAVQGSAFKLSLRLYGLN